MKKLLLIVALLAITGCSFENPVMPKQECKTNFMIPWMTIDHPTNNLLINLPPLTNLANGYCMVVYCKNGNITQFTKKGSNYFIDGMNVMKAIDLLDDNNITFIAYSNHTQFNYFQIIYPLVNPDWIKIAMW